jgi:hypothetical protein
MLGEWITNLLKEFRRISPDSRVGAFKFIESAGISSASQFVVAVNPFVLLHHQNLRVHLRLFKSLTSHLCLEISGSCRVYTFNVIESGLNLLFLKLALILHEVFCLIMQKQVSPIQHI